MSYVFYESYVMNLSNRLKGSPMSAKPVVVAVTNRKGGVSKSLITTQLAGALARRGLRVLAVDMDPQGNLSRRLGVDVPDDNTVPTVSDVILAGEVGAGAGAVLPCGWSDTPEAELIDVIAARDTLENREAEAGAPGAWRRLAKGLSGEWIDAYDVVLIDTRPSLGHSVQMVLAASDYVLIPTVLDMDGNQSVVKVIDFVNRHAEDLANPGLKIGGVLVTRYMDRAEFKYQLRWLRENLGDLTWDLSTTRTLLDGTVEEVTPAWIPEMARLLDANSAGASISAYRDVKGLKAKAIFDNLAEVFVQRFIQKEN